MGPRKSAARHAVGDDAGVYACDGEAGVGGEESVGLLV